jgi:hypothetical protein
MHEITQISAGGFSAVLTSTQNIILWGTGEFGCFKTP